MADRQAAFRVEELQARGVHRELALLPYSQRTTTERAGGGRGPRPDRRRDADETPSAAEQLGVDLGDTEAEETGNDQALEEV